MNVIPPEAVHVSQPAVERVADYSALDLTRLRSYIGERVKESRRLANATSYELIRRAHQHSAAVGQQIFDEIVKLEEQANG